MAGWEDAPVVTPPPGSEPKAAWERAPVVGQQAQATQLPRADDTPVAGAPGQGRAATLEAPHAAPEPISPFAGFLRSHYDNELAARQGVNPNALSQYFHDKPENKVVKLGELEETDAGQFYRLNGQGEPLIINHKTDFIARDPETQKMAVYARNALTDESRLASLARMIVPGLAVGPVSSSIRAVPEAAEAAAAALPHSSALAPAAARARAAGTVGNAVGADIAAKRAADMGADVAAFDRLAVRKPPIAFTGPAAGGLGQMVSRIPFIGAPIKNSLDQGLAGARDAARAMSRDMAPSASVEQAGQTLQGGLDRFRTAGVRDIEPGVLGELGIQPRAPGAYVGELVPPLPGSAPLAPTRQAIVQPDGTLAYLDPAQHIVVNDAGRQSVFENAARGRPAMSAEALNRAQEAAPIREALQGGTALTNRGVTVPAARPLDQVIMGRRGAADLSDAELSRLIRTPSSETSFATRAEALYEKAWRSVPSFMRINNTSNPNMLATANTRAALRGIEGDIANQIAGQGTIGGDLAARIRNPRSGNFTLDDMRAIRTEVGRSLSNFTPYQASLNRSQLKGLYGALSKDIEVGLQDLANRAYTRTGISNNRPDYIAPDVARRADQALRDFRTADRYFRQGIDRMDRFAKVAGTDNPQQAAGLLIRSALDGTKGNMGMLRSAMGALRPEERRQFSALVLDQMGKPRPGARGMVEEAQFSPTTFMTRWNEMNPNARTLLFGGEYQQAMDDLVRVVKRLSSQEALANTSRSGTDIVNYLTMVGGSAMAMNGHTAILGALLGPTAVFSAMMGSPATVRWLAQYARLRAAALRAPVNDTAPRMVVLLNQLNRMAVKDPALVSVQRAIAAENGVGDRREQQNPVQH